jgi:hypothetical protein
MNWFAKNLDQQQAKHIASQAEVEQDLPVGTVAAQISQKFPALVAGHFLVRAVFLLNLSPPQFEI